MNKAPSSGPCGQVSQSFACNEAAVEGCRQTILALFGPASIDERALMRIEVVLEELVSNVVRHAQGARSITLSAAWQAGALDLQVSDDGEAFDPVAAPEPAPFTELGEARLGGLGIDLVRKLSTSLAYRRSGEGAEARNTVHVTMPAPLAA